MRLVTPSDYTGLRDDAPVGGTGRTRTDCLLLARQALSLVSYNPKPGSLPWHQDQQLRWVGIEPTYAGVMSAPAYR